jgi:endothelin-converting enzyme/putative endopeptidase
MRLLHVLPVLLVPLVPLVASGDGRHGILVGDLDRSADPCGDFFQFANGAWRKENPIPPSMVRWSRRWAAGERSKEQLRTLLDEMKGKEWPVGSIDQQAADFYGSCMDEKTIEALGTKPIQPLLADIRAINGPESLQAILARLHELQWNALFGFASMPDNHNPADVISHVFPAGLGMPDRDYYLKSEPRFVEAREKYRAHLIRMFQLSGYSGANARKASDDVFAMEKRLAAAQLDNVSLRDPAATDH